MGSVSRRRFVRLVASALAAAAVPSLSSCSRSISAGTSAEGERRTTVFCFDTVCTMGGVMDQDVLDEAERLCMRYEQLLSRTIATSDVGCINAAGGSPVDVDPQTAELIEVALRYCAESGGLFDITIGAVSELWDFANKVVPSPEAIAKALPHVGWEGVDVVGSTVRLADPDARIDLGGIAKGYIADRLVDLFGEHGVESGFVNLGGNVKVLGNKPDGSPWNVGVRDPFADNDAAVHATIELADASLVTSGLYERAFELDGKRYWHILDPRTGYPVETRVVSASICSAASVDGDGYTKPLFMLEHDEALEFVARHDGLQALLIEEDGSSYTTPGAAFILA